MCDWCCATLTPSKLWRTRHDDLMAGKQRWDCWHLHRYRAFYGQLVELTTLGERLTHAWAEVTSGAGPKKLARQCSIFSRSAPSSATHMVKKERAISTHHSSARR